MSILQQRASDVRIREFDLSQIVTSASSSVAGVVIISNQGREGLMHFTDGDTFLNEYYNRDNPVLPVSVGTALDFFKEGNSLWACRALGTDYKYSGVLLYDDGGVTKLMPITHGISNPNDIDFVGIAPPSTTPLGVFIPKQGPGSYGDRVGVEIESTNISYPTNLIVSSTNTGGRLNAATYRYMVSCITPSGETLISPHKDIVIAGTGVTNSVTVSWDEVKGALGYRVYGRTNAGIGLLLQVGQGTNSFVDTGALVPDTTVLPITSPSDAPEPSPVFLVHLYNRDFVNSPAETFPCTLEPMTDEDGLALEVEERINPFSSIAEFKSYVPNLPSAPVVHSVDKTLMAGGDSGTAPTNFDVSRAYERFSNKELYDVQILIGGGHNTPNVQKKIDEIAQRRGDAIGLLDVPSARQQYMDSINYRNLDLNLNSTYSALFAADVLQEDNINGRIRYTPFSGWAAALCARTDRVANPSFSIAGLNRGLVNVLKARHSYDDGQASEMFKAQVNYLRTFKGLGIPLWEQQTLNGKQSALSWLSVRRITNVIKTSLYRYGLYIIQEPNDDFTRRQLVSTFSEYLDVIKDARGISSYSVVSDNSNNPVAFENGGVLRVTVIIVPTIPVHELQIDIAISKQGVSFEETLNNLYGNS